MSVISAEVAEKEVQGWLDFKKVPDSKRILLAGNIAAMTLAITDGVLSIDPETKVITHKLAFPIGTNSELKYKPRLNMREIQDRTQNIGHKDAIGLTCAYVSALSGLAPSIVKEMDEVDFSTADKIAFFFMA